MPHSWEQTIKIDVELAHELIRDQFNLSIRTITLLDEGWDNAVYLVNDDLIFRFPRRKFGLSCMENEILLLPYLSQHVTFPCSAPKWIGHPSANYPYPFEGYPFLPGKSLCDATLSLIDNKTFAETLALWLKELHSVSVRSSDLQLLKGDHDWRLNVAHRVQRCHQNLDQYGHFFIEAGFKKEHLLKVIDKLNHFKIAENKKTYVHGDLYHRHVLVDSDILLPTGIIDWGDIHIGEPGIDLAVGMIFMRTAFEEFLKAYGTLDHNTMMILQLHAFAHAMSFLPYAYEQGRKHLKIWACLQLNRAAEEINC